MDFIAQPHHYSAKYPENRRHGHHRDVETGSGHISGHAADKRYKHGRLPPAFKALVQRRPLKGQINESRRDSAAHSNVQVLVMGTVDDQVVSGHPYNITLKILAHHLAQGLNAKASQGTQLDKL